MCMDSRVFLFIPDIECFYPFCILMKTVLFIMVVRLINSFHTTTKDKYYFKKI